jgi:hypothetical protein
VGQVGYGDITADNSAERIAYILLFMGGAFIWGTLLAEVGEIHNASSQRETAKMESIQKMLNFLQDNDVSAELRSLSYLSLHLGAVEGQTRTSPPNCVAN